MKIIHCLYGMIVAAMAILVLMPASVSPAGAASLPDKQWGAPVMPGGALVKSEDTAIFISYDQPYEKVLEWYKKALENYPDEKYRDWKDQMYIEDQGGAKWHSIGVFKGGGTKTTVKIVKDNWTWILSTLLIRFAGVFFVLVLLWMLLSLSSLIMRKFIVPEEGKSKTG